jgi:hypothetical protein
VFFVKNTKTRRCNGLWRTQEDWKLYLKSKNDGDVLVFAKQSMLVYAGGKDMVLHCTGSWLGKEVKEERGNACCND